jgi:hypothetical protein
MMGAHSCGEVVYNRSPWEVAHSHNIAQTGLLSSSYSCYISVSVYIHEFFSSTLNNTSAVSDAFYSRMQAVYED